MISSFLMIVVIESWLWVTATYLESFDPNIGAGFFFFVGPHVLLGGLVVTITGAFLNRQRRNAQEQAWVAPAHSEIRPMFLPGNLDKAKRT